MSLLGLDSPQIQEAHQIAIAEPAGWFLLKYISRDSVDLLARGKAGVHEARNAIATYPETSPLYGLISYRRRRVLLKYVPDGTSRVLKARTAVHFQDVQEKFAPYETLLEFTTAEGLNDTSLAASFPLHTATPSASSSRLDEISEDAEDGGATAQTPASHTSSSYFSSQRHRPERRPEQQSPPPRQMRSEPPPIASPTLSHRTSPQKTSISQYLVREDSSHRSITSLTAPSVASSTQYASSEQSSRDTQSTTSSTETPKATTPTTPQFKPLPSALTDHSRKHSMQEQLADRLLNTTGIQIPRAPVEPPAMERTFTSPPASASQNVSEPPKFDDDPYDFSKYDPKPKVKLGPRPVAPAEKAKRPMVASVSSVPASFRSTAKKQDQSRPSSQVPPALTGPTLAQIRSGLPAPPPIPDMPEYNPRPLSRGSVKSLPSHKSTGMTPDKIRLMKAVELRKKQLRKSNPTPDSFVPPPDEDVPDVPKVPDRAPEREIERPIGGAFQARTRLQDEQHALSNKSDSGIAMDFDKAHRREPSNTDEQPQNEEVKSTQVEPSQPVSQDLKFSTQQSPRIDTPRVPTGQAFVEREIPPQRSADTPRKLHVTELQMSRNTPATTHASSLPTREVPVLPSSSTDDAVNVPTIVMADGSRPISATAKQLTAEKSSPVESYTQLKNADESAGSNDELEPPERDIRRKPSDIAKRRRGFVEPLNLDNDDDFMSDDEFMEELQSATFQEAKPMTVARSPVPHYVPRRPSANSALSEVSVNSVRQIQIEHRASETPLDFADAQDRLTPGPAIESRGHSRSTSTPPSEKYDPMAAFKRNVSNGISKRIQALSERTSQENTRQGSPPTQASGQEFSSTGLIPKEQSQVSQAPQPKHSRNGSFRAPWSRHSSRISTSQHYAPTYTPSQPDNGPIYNIQPNANTGVDSVSVSARIVRPPVVEQADTAAETERELQQSKLVISHKRGTPSQPGLPKLHRLDTNAKPETYQPSSPTMTRNPSDGTRVLNSSNQTAQVRSPLSPSPDDFPPPPSFKTQPSVQVPSHDENLAPKQSTRTSRFFKRMSVIGGSKRQSNGPQSVANSSSPVSERNSSNANFAASIGSKDKLELPPALVVGDLNIQFPDSLLWKRRIVEIDDAGYIIFSIMQAMEHQRGVAKKYSLQEFRMPYVPDLDRQELANSIMLDFVDGTTLQIACEDTMTHRQVVHVLKTYWKAWTAV